MFAAHHRLANLVAILDLNGQQALGYTRDVLDLLSRWRERWRAFGWDVHEVDGHDVAAAARDASRGSIPRSGPPHVLDRAHGVRQGRLLHGEPDQVALLADVGRGVRAGARRGGGDRERRVREDARRARRARPAHHAAHGRPGYMALEPFAEQFPDRFFNVGRRRAEHGRRGDRAGRGRVHPVRLLDRHLRGAAALRVHPQRPGPAPVCRVRIVGVGGGFEYGTNGLSPLRARGRRASCARSPASRSSRPPTTSRRARRCSRRWDLPGPIYYRLGKDDKTGRPGPRRALRARPRRSRSATGPTCCSSRWAASRARRPRRARRSRAAASRARVAIVASVSPAPVDDLARLLAARARWRCHVEAHYIVGGLGSLVAEVIAERRLDCRLMRCGVAIAAERRHREPALSVRAATAVARTGVGRQIALVDPAARRDESARWQRAAARSSARSSPATAMRPPCRSCTSG